MQSQQLEDQNRMLSEKDAQNIADMENLRQQLVELMEDNERKEAIPIKEKNKVKKKKRWFCGVLLVLLLSKWP